MLNHCVVFSGLKFDQKRRHYGGRLWPGFFGAIWSVQSRLRPIVPIKIVFLRNICMGFWPQRQLCRPFQGRESAITSQNGPWGLCGSYEKIFHGREIILTFQATESKIPNVLYAESMRSGVRRVPTRAASLCMVSAQSVCGVLAPRCIYSRSA